MASQASWLSVTEKEGADHDGGLGVIIICGDVGPVSGAGSGEAIEGSIGVIIVEGVPTTTGCGCGDHVLERFMSLAKPAGTDTGGKLTEPVVIVVDTRSAIGMESRSKDSTVSTGTN